MDLRPFTSLIKSRTGLWFGSTRATKLAEAVQTAISRKGIGSTAEYYRLILHDEDQFVELINSLTINETYFFREPIHLKLLTTHLIPNLLREKKSGHRIRVLSAGCSTGEEPYSLLMATVEHMGLNACRLLEVMGIDLDSEALSKARKGVYGGQSFRGFPPHLKEKYFEKIGTNQYRIKDWIRENVEFRVFNLATDLYPEHLKGLDIIFYRNVSIYFQPDTRRKIFTNLSGMLNDRGYFVTSATETLSHNLDVLSLVERDGAFFYQKTTSQEAGEASRRTASLLPHHSPGEEGHGKGGPSKRVFPHPSTLPNTAELEKGDKSVGWVEALRNPTGTPIDVGLRRASTQPTIIPRLNSPELPAPPEDPLEKALTLAEGKRYDEALRLLDALTAKEPAPAPAFALKGHILVNLERLEDAAQACLKAIEIDSLCVAPYLLLGLIARQTGDLDDAGKRFREALYIRPSCWPARFYLAEVHQSRGQLEKARREYGIILNQFEKGELANPGLPFFPLSISVEQMMHLCRHKLSHLERV